MADSNSIFDQAISSLTSDPLRALGVAGLGANLLFGDPKSLPAERSLEQQAGEAGRMARTLAGYQQSGTLPSGFQSIVDQQFNAAKGAVVDQYSRLGLGNSTMLADKLNSLRAEKTAEVAQLANRFAAEGIEWSRLNAEDLTAILGAQTNQEVAFQSAVSSFARGLAGGVLTNAAS